jgi:poly(3-hydroxyalkanoate) depolymerase
MNIKTIDLNGQIIRVTIKPGKVGTVPLLLCTGIGASLELLIPFVDALHKVNPDIEIISFDYPGCGESSTPTLPYRFSGLAKTITQMLDYLNYAQVNVLGLSWGGFISTQLVYDSPHRVKKLVLCATATGCTSIPPSLKVLSLMASPRRYSDPTYMAEIAPLIYGGAFRTNPKLATEYAAKMHNNKSEAKPNGMGYKFQQLAICWWSSLWMLPSIKQSTLLIGADDDPIIDLRNMQLMSKLIPNSGLYVVKNGGHLFLLTHLDEIVPIIEEFLSN